jgi:hypothetical protein
MIYEILIFLKTNFLLLLFLRYSFSKQLPMLTKVNKRFFKNKVCKLSVIIQ